MKDDGYYAYCMAVQLSDFDGRAVRGLNVARKRTGIPHDSGIHLILIADVIRKEVIVCGKKMYTGVVRRLAGES